MATGGVAVETDSRVTCSVCLEPYRGRHPKLLPCFHTFCLPCLTQLTSAGQHSGQVSPGEREETRRTLTCPTCRTTHPLPPRGVRGLQANFYVENFNQADNADREADPVSRTQQAGDLGDDLQAKVKDQLKVMEAVMSRLAEEEEEIDRQKKVVEVDIQERYDTGVRMLGECRDECLVSLTEAAGQLTDKVQAEMTSARGLMTSLTDVLSANSTKAQSVMLSESALRHFRQLGIVRQQPPSLFSYTKTTNMAAVGDGLRQLMGSVAPSGGVPGQQRSDSGTDSKEEVSTEFLQLLTNASYAEVVKLRHDLTTLQTQLDTHSAQLQDGHLHLKEDIQQLKADNQHLKTDIQQLKTENVRLREGISHDKTEDQEENIQQKKTDIESLKKEMTSLNDQLQLDMGSLREQVATDVGAVQKKVAVIEGDIGDLQKDMETTASTTMKGVTSATQDVTVSSLLTDVRTVKKNITSLQAQMGKLNTPVFFNARLNNDKIVPDGQTVILDTVLANTGGGYDVTTGVFTAPLTATYLFIATARADGNYVCLQKSNTPAHFDIVVEGKTVASSWSRGSTSCTAHAVVRLDSGHKVSMKAVTLALPTSNFRGNGYTSFCGILVQPEL